MDSLAGQQLMKADGSKHNADEVMADVELILYYFSAHWCPPCRGFTPLLKEFYKSVSDKKLEIVFVSSDQDESAMISYMKESHGDWYAVEHESDLAKNLEKKYDIEGIPTLVVCKKDGTVVTSDAVGDVAESKAEAVAKWSQN